MWGLELLDDEMLLDMRLIDAHLVPCPLLEYLEIGS